MRVALVADVEEESVVSEVEDVVQRDRQLNDTEIRREVTAGLHDLAGDRFTNLRRKRLELVDRQRLDVGGGCNGGQALGSHDRFLGD